MSWEVLRLKRNERAFIIRGHGFVLHGEVWRGAMKGDVYWGLKALESPTLAAWLRQRWRVAAPRRFASEDNTGVNRKYIEFEPLASGAPFALRFQEYVPTELLQSLRAAFGGASQKEPEDEEHAGAAVLDSPEGALGRGAGRPVEGEDRQPAGPRQDPRPKGKVVKRRRKKKGR